MQFSLSASGGGNSELMADAAWSSLATTTNHPEYPAAHGCVTGASSRLVEDVFGTRKVHVVVDNNAFGRDETNSSCFHRRAGIRGSRVRVGGPARVCPSPQDGPELDSAGNIVGRSRFAGNLDERRLHSHSHEPAP
jgi:hypothetical protein